MREANDIRLIPPAVLAICFAMLLGALGLRAQKAGPGVGQRYLVLGTWRLSTLESELRVKAAAGYRVVGGWSAPEITERTSTNSQRQLLLEKVATPPNTYEYLVLQTNTVFTLQMTLTNWVSTLQKKIKEAGARGYRLLPQVEVGARTVLMEKAPGSSTRYDYIFLPYGLTVGSVSPENASLEAAMQGYALVADMCRCMVGTENEDRSMTEVWSIEHVLVAEKATGETSTTKPRDTASSGRERYRVLLATSSNGSTRWADMWRDAASKVEGLLREAAGKGYRLLFLSDYDCPEVVLGMEDAGVQGDERYDYSVVSRQDQMDAAAAKGFHPHPHGLVIFPAVVMERAPGARAEHEYLLLEQPNSSALQHRMLGSDVAETDFVTAAHTAHAVVMRRPAAGLAEARRATGTGEALHEAPSPPRPSASRDKTEVPRAVRVVIDEMKGFRRFLTAAFGGNNVPLDVVDAATDADFQVFGAVTFAPFSSPVGRSAPQETLTVTMNVRDIKTGRVAFATVVQRISQYGDQANSMRSAADECARWLAKTIPQRSSR